MSKKNVLFALSLLSITYFTTCGGSKSMGSTNDVSSKAADKWSYNKEQTQGIVTNDRIIPEGYKLTEYVRLSQGLEDFKNLTSAKGVDLKKAEEILGAEGVYIPACDNEGNKTYIFWAKGELETSSPVFVMVTFRPISGSNKYEYAYWSSGIF